MRVGFCGGSLCLVKHKAGNSKVAKLVFLSSCSLHIPAPGGGLCSGPICAHSWGALGRRWEFQGHGGSFKVARLLGALEMMIWVISEQRI